MTSLRRAVSNSVVLLLLCAAIFAAPAALNRKPFLFFDSAQYFDIGGAIVRAVLPAGAAPAAAPAPATAPDAPKAEKTEGGLLAIAGGRSPVYSVMTFVLGDVGTLFAV